jgi:taurine dioxygenase
MKLTALSDVMGVEATGIDLSNPVDDATRQALKDALHRHIVLCIRDQHLEPAEFLQAAEIFGPLKVQTYKHLSEKELPALGWVSSDDRDVHGTGKRVVRGRTWHTDHSFSEIPPKATTLYGTDIPSSGGDTSFCNLRLAYRSLPEETRKRIDGLKVVHTYQSSRSPRKDLLKLSAEEKAATPDVIQPLVRTHPDTGEKALYLNPTRTECILDLPRDESDAILDEVEALLDEPAFHYDHKWRLNDMVIWDNRCSAHHANGDWPEDERRFLYRTMIEGERPY